MIGMPADLALARESLIALAFGTETARPSTFCETAASISCACFCGSLFDGLQMSLTPSALAAASAPFLTTDQNEPSSEWVTMATVMSTSAAGALPELVPLVVVAEPPELVDAPPHAAANTASAARTSTARHL